MKPGTQPLDRVNPRAGFDNYAEMGYDNYHNNFSSLLALIIYYKTKKKLNILASFLFFDIEAQRNNEGLHLI
jgi:hypothetical protein